MNIDENSAVMKFAEEGMKSLFNSIYYNGVDEGELSILKKLIHYYKEKEKCECPCFLYILGWEDNGCCCNCLECVETHYHGLEDDKDE